MKFIALSIVLLLMGSSLFAQSKGKVPKWVTTPPSAPAGVQRVRAQGATFEEARHNAINQLIGNTNLVCEDNSYRKRLLDSGREPISQHQALVKAAEQSLFLPTKDKYEGEDGCWVLCEMTKKGIEQFSDSLRSAIQTNSYNKLKQGRNLHQDGDIYGAAQVYSEALQEVVPMLHKYLTCDEGDLVELLREAYVHSLDSIEVKLDLHNQAMVRGEELPRDLLISATCLGKPVSALPIDFNLTPQGSLVEHATTDGKGRAKTRIIQAPDADNAKLTVTPNLKQMVSTLSQNIFTEELARQIATEQSQDELTLTAFDPTPTYHLQPLAEGDMSYLGDSLQAVMERSNYQPVTQPTEADVLLTHTFSYEPEGEATTGKYSMQYFICSLEIKATDRRTNHELAKIEKAGLRFFLKADVTPEQIQTEATNELYRRLRHQMKRLNNLNFDKRQMMFFGVN